MKDKLERAMAKLKDRFALDVSEPNLLFMKEGNLEQLGKNLYHVYFKLWQLVTDCFSEEWFTLHGSLLPTNNGHNSSLTTLELNILNDFIRVTQPEELREVAAMRQEENEQADYEDMF
jgi:hypothetical protein